MSDTLLISIIGWFVVIVGWVFTEGTKQAYDRKKSREAKYTALMEASISFYRSIDDPNLKIKFFQELNSAWIYCPDHIIDKGYEFLDTVQHNDGYDSDVQKAHREYVFGEFALAMRKEVYGKRTKFSTVDYRFLYRG